MSMFQEKLTQNYTSNCYFGQFIALELYCIVTVIPFINFSYRLSIKTIVRCVNKEGR